MMKPFLAISAAILWLSGCTTVESSFPVVGALDVASVVNTKKTIDDHVVSLVSGKDCSTIRALKGEKYCQEDEHAMPTILRTSYCYKNLASITCYDHQLNNGTEPLGTRVDYIPVSPGP